MFKKQQGQQFVELKSKSGDLRKFTKVKYLGSGGFARCYEVYEQLQGIKKNYAVKIIKKSTLYQSKQLIERLRTEIKLHKKFSEPDELQNTHIVRFIDSFQTQDYIYLLLQLCVNQTLNQLIRRRKILSEEQTRFFIKQLAEGLKQLHSKNVVHRDIKLCNLFLSNELVLKIGDFGLATEIKQNKKRFTLCGTANYIAPQMIQKNSNGTTIGHAYQVDVWALGVVCYTIYYGRYPFEAQEQQSIYNKIIACKYSFNPYTMREMKDLNINGLGHFPSEQLQSFIKSIFQIDPAKRLTLDQVLQHPFLNKTTVPKQLPQIALKCQLKKETLDTIFVQQQKNSVSQKKISNCFNENCKSPKIVKKIQESKNNFVIQNNQSKIKNSVKNPQTTDDRIESNPKENQQPTCKNKNAENFAIFKLKKPKNKDQKIYFKFERKLTKSFNKKAQQNYQMQKRQLNSQRVCPKFQKSQKILMQVILNKNKDIQQNLKGQESAIGSNGMIIKVYSKNIESLNEEVDLTDKGQDYCNEYSLILHPKLKYLTKIYDKDKFQRLPLNEVDKLPQNLNLNENDNKNSVKQSKIHILKEIPQKLRDKKVIKIPLIADWNSNNENENFISKKYQEEFFIVKMVFKKLQNLSSSKVQNIQGQKTQHLKNQQRCKRSPKKQNLTSLNDVVKNDSPVGRDPSEHSKTEKQTVESFKCHQNYQLAY